jgi:hypothetical protein
VTEAEWSSCESWLALLNASRSRASLRKIRLFACASTRELWESLDSMSRQAVEVGERYADGDDGTTERMQVESAARMSYHSATGRCRVNAAHAALLCSQKRFDDFRPAILVEHSQLADNYKDTPQTIAMRAKLIALFRDIFANPFHPVAFDPRWQSETTVALASAIYAERAFDRMPILADALEDAGCDNADILAHCRQPDGVHARGCWVVDLVLGMV